VVRIAAVLLLCTGCPFAAAVPGSRTDVSPMTTQSNGARHAGVQFATGAHWASLGTNDKSFDVGAGYIYQHLPSEASAVESSIEKRDDDDDAMEEDPGISLHGGYLSFDRNVHARRRWRTWAGVRGELWRHTTGDMLPGGSVRLGVELYGSSSTAEPVASKCAAGIGLVHGTTALGVFFDAGARMMPGGEVATTASAGISVRLPNLAVFGVAIPKCR
jgi:hypothetical protein